MRPRHYLLAASGASATSALRNLKVLNAEAGPRAAAVTAEQPDVDLQGYLANVRAKSTLDMIDGALEQSKRDFDNFIAERVQINWEEQRQRTFEHFGLLRRNFDGKADGSVTNDRAKGSFGRSTRGRALGSSQNADAQKWFGSTSGMRSVIGSDLRGSHNGTIFSDRADNPGLDGSGLQSDSRHFREKQDYLASKTREFNRARLEEVTFPVFSHYCAVEAELATDVGLSS